MWRDLYKCVGLNYARDRLVEGYLWCYAIYHEKEFAFSRIFLTKQLMLISLMDDTYDAHATIEECRQLNVAIQRFESLDFIYMHVQKLTCNQYSIYVMD